MESVSISSYKTIENFLSLSGLNTLNSPLQMLLRLPQRRTKRQRKRIKVLFPSISTVAKIPAQLVDYRSIQHLLRSNKKRKLKNQRRNQKRKAKMERTRKEMVCWTGLNMDTKIWTKVMKSTLEKSHRVRAKERPEFLKQGKRVNTDVFVLAHNRIMISLEARNSLHKLIYLGLRICYTERPKTSLSNMCIFLLLNCKLS
mmetsp:Transcript_1542/g.3219  ORF Transcript_1542/g.3219 Transcript_1542/m.3219 type:complete len:200 (+) Transcript_1542:117-716(+)